MADRNNTLNRDAVLARARELKVTAVFEDDADDAPQFFAHIADLVADLHAAGTVSPVPPDGEPRKLRAAIIGILDGVMPGGVYSPHIETAADEIVAAVAAGRAAATPDPPDAADLVAAHLRERWPCTCRPGMDGGGVYHAADCNSRREGSQAVLAVIRLLRAATPPASPDERLREAVAALPQYVITIQDREGYTYERGCEGQPMNYTGVMLADVEALVGKLKDGATTARETTNELKDAAADRDKEEDER